MNDRTAPASRPGLPGRPPANPARRLSPPPNGPSVLLTVLLALSAAALTAAVTGWFAWPPTTLPTNTVASGWAALAVPDTTSTVTARQQPPFAYHPPVRGGLDRLLVPLLGGDDYRAAGIDLTAGPLAHPDGVFTRAQQHLAAAGWQVGPVDQDRYGRQFTARTASAVMTLSITTEVGDDGLHPGRFDPVAAIRITTPPPTAGVRVPVLIGWLLGATVGWGAGVALTRRLARRTGRQRTNILTVCAIGLLLATPLALTGTYIDAAYQLGIEPTVTDPAAPWQPYMIMYLRIPALLGIAAMLVAAWIAVAGNAEPDRQRR